jgi:hypothetical protein
VDEQHTEDGVAHLQIRLARADWNRLMVAEGLNDRTIGLEREDWWSEPEVI